MNELELYGYWRSSAAFRLRIALNLKGVTYTQKPVNIAPDQSEQRSEAYLALNPQGRVPALKVGDVILTQSMAILEWLDETYSQSPFVFGDAISRAQIRSFADTIACDIHPLNNLSVLRKLSDDFEADGENVKSWYQHWIRIGFDALHASLPGEDSGFLFGGSPSLAEICLIPQIWNARRFDMDLSAYPRFEHIEQRCYELEAFQAARPENQPDAPKS